MLFSINCIRLTYTVRHGRIIRVFLFCAQYINLLRHCDQPPNGENFGLADNETLRVQLEEVQTQMAYQEDAVRELNDALSLQQQEILLLRRQIQLLKQRQDEQGTGPDGAAAPADEKPPHY
jgi:SlyX protein